MYKTQSNRLAWVAAFFSALAVVFLVAAFFAIGEANALTVTDAAAAYGNPTMFQDDTAQPWQADGRVVFDWGNIAADLLTSLGVAVAALAAWALRKLPAGVVAMVDRMSQTFLQKSASELLEISIGYGINTTAGAVRGKSMSFEVGSAVIERAVEYALRNAPGVVDAMGGLLRLREKIVARLDVGENVALPASQLSVPVGGKTFGIERVTPPAPPAAEPATP